MRAPQSTMPGARSLLFLPATKLERFAKALGSGADCIIIDLEDAVADGSKDNARARLAQFLSELAPTQQACMMVRVNAIGTPWHDADIEMLGGWTGLGLAVMLPKSEDAGALRNMAGKLGALARIVALIESLAGLDAADALAQEPQVSRLAFGHLDFQLDLGIHASPGEPELAVARSILVAASRRAGLRAPIDGVTVETGNIEQLVIDAQRARAFGFGGKLCIHPGQVASVNRAFGSTQAEQKWAQRVLAEAAKRDGGVFSLDGRMVDLPVIRAAEAILANAKK
jgi:citrate lyase subunit beta/citryl-CoA lyase